MFVAAFGGLALASRQAPHVSHGLTAGRAVAFQLVTGVAALTAIWAIVMRRWAVARIAAAAQVSLILWGWVLVQYPFVIPWTSTLREAAAPRVTLVLLLYALLGGAAVLLPSLFYLYRSFSGSDARQE
jgi:cytochrome d ubiquinol oxidase subunit II